MTFREYLIDLKKKWRPHKLVLDYLIKSIISAWGGSLIIGTGVTLGIVLNRLFFLLIIGGVFSILYSSYCDNQRANNFINLIDEVTTKNKKGG